MEFHHTREAVAHPHIQGWARVDTRLIAKDVVVICSSGTQIIMGDASCKCPVIMLDFLIPQDIFLSQRNSQLGAKYPASNCHVSLTDIVHGSTKIGS